MLELSQKSIVFATSCVCLPGILYNLQKLREIKCFKGVCLKYWVPAGLVEASDCYQQFAYYKCKEWVGQVGTVIIEFLASWLTDPIRGLMKKFEEAFNNPEAWALSLLKYGSQQLCYQGQWLACKAVGTGGCTVHWAVNCLPLTIIEMAESAALIYQSVQTALSFEELFSKESNTYCEQFLDGVCINDNDCDEGFSCDTDSRTCIEASE